MTGPDGYKAKREVETWIHSGETEKFKDFFRLRICVEMWSEVREVYNGNQIITGTRNQKQPPAVTAKHTRKKTKEKATVAHKVANNDLCKELSCTAKGH